MYELLGPVSYQGKDGCESVICRQMPDGKGGYRRMGWHCSYCDEPCSYQGHMCDAAKAILGEAEKVLDERRD